MSPLSGVAGIDGRWAKAAYQAARRGRIKRRRQLGVITAEVVMSRDKVGSTAPV